jgi:plasmid stabilization system protein ParE
MLIVVYTKRAIRQSEIIKRYLSEKFTQREVDHFYALLNDFENVIVEFPELFRKSSTNSQLHRAVLSKQLSVFYRHSKHEITVMGILDNRMNPKRWP